MNWPRLAVAVSWIPALLADGRPGRADDAFRVSDAGGGIDAGDAGYAVMMTGTTVLFPYRQRRLLYSRNADGGLAYVTPRAIRGASLPVVVFLHGMNPDARIHPWFGAFGTFGAPEGDLRPGLESLVISGKVAPFVVAAPTHTRFATGATVMWPKFDIDEFLTATEVALGDVAKIDRTRIIVVGHSGAGCNATGGILAESVRLAAPLALLDVDGCVDDNVIVPLTQASATTSVLFFWQRTWVRPIAGLASACPLCRVEEVANLPAGVPPHIAILPEALRRALPLLLPGERSYGTTL